MVSYSCPRCGCSFKQKSHIHNHLRRKNICNSIIEDISVEKCLEMLNKKPLHKCKCCNKEFKYKSYLKRHIILCQEKYIEKLEEEKRNLIECKTVNINNITIDNSKNITINSYNQTDIEGLKDDIEKLKIKNKKDEEVILNLLEMIHLNDKYPQNHNLYIENANLKRLMKLEGDKFEERGRGNKAIEDFLMKDVSKYIDNSFLSSSDFNVIYDSFMTKYYNYDAEDSKNKQKDADEKSRILGIFFNAFYNGRHLIKDTARNNGIKVK